MSSLQVDELPLVADEGGRPRVRLGVGREKRLPLPIRRLLLRKVSGSRLSRQLVETWPGTLAINR